MAGGVQQNEIWNFSFATESSLLLSNWRRNVIPLHLTFVYCKSFVSFLLFFVKQPTVECNCANRCLNPLCTWSQSRRVENRVTSRDLAVWKFRKIVVWWITLHHRCFVRSRRKGGSAEWIDWWFNCVPNSPISSAPSAIELLSVRVCPWNNWNCAFVVSDIGHQHLWISSHR